MHVSYPAGLPTDCLGTIIEIVRTGAVATRTPELAHCLWNVQGYAQRTLIGNPEGFSTQGEDVGATADDTAVCQDALSCMQSLSDDTTSEGFNASADANKLAIDPAIISLIIQVALPLFKTWIEKFINRK